MQFEGKTFTQETVDLDFNRFVNCRFERCVLVFHGFGAISMDGCSFSFVDWRFVDAAATTLQFMTGLYHGAGPGGRELIEKTFEGIRKAESVIK